MIRTPTARGAMLLTRSDYNMELIIFIIAAIRVNLALTGTPQNRGKGVWTKGGYPGLLVEVSACVLVSPSVETGGNTGLGA